jgi:hypothetical protein
MSNNINMHNFHLYKRFICNHPKVKQLRIVYLKTFIKTRLLKGTRIKSSHVLKKDFPSNLCNTIKDKLSCHAII